MPTLLEPPAAAPSSPGPVATARRDPASFRDPEGRVYRGTDGRLYRQLHASFLPHRRRLAESGLESALVEEGLLIPHEPAPLTRRLTDEAVAVLQPRELPFLSYPYEWCFGELQAAALLTLDLQLRALEAGLTLKDASAYNVQFEGTRPVFLDLTSFETWEPGTPWVAYGQFCRHFLAPLALMAHVDPRLADLLAVHLDGVPLDLASRALPLHTRLRPGLLAHLHLHAALVRRAAAAPAAPASSRARRIAPRGLVALIEGLRRAVAALRWKPAGTEWAEYEDALPYTRDEAAAKERVVARWLDRLDAKSVWDLGANTGRFSRIAAARGAATVAFDLDPACVERCWRAARAEGLANLLPLRLDLAAPSPALGWAHEERRSLADRGPAGVALALALVHHLSITRNVPFPDLARYLARIARAAIVEFVPREDPQAARLLAARSDPCAGYTEARFRAAFAGPFELLDSEPVGTGGRVLHLLVRRKDPS
jgi:ribosomal protein L11 methylase PrmA